MRTRTKLCFRRSPSFVALRRPHLGTLMPSRRSRSGGSQRHWALSIGRTAPHILIRAPLNHRAIGPSSQPCQRAFACVCSVRPLGSPDLSQASCQIGFQFRYFVQRCRHLVRAIAQFGFASAYPPLRAGRATRLGAQGNAEPLEPNIDRTTAMTNLDTVVSPSPARQNSQAIIIFDTTLRDGEQSPAPR